MKKQLEQRLENLRTEFQEGRTMLAELDKKQADLQQTLTRIAGAIQVLEEELAKAGGEVPAPVEAEA